MQLLELLLMLFAMDGVWCAIDTLLSGEFKSFGEARDKTKRRLAAAAAEAGRQLKHGGGSQNGMSSSISSKPDDDFGWGAGAGRYPRPLTGAGGGAWIDAYSCSCFKNMSKPSSVAR